jgi:iron complex transport system ATP-binding protein
MISAHQITVRAGTTLLLDAVSVEAARGEILAVVGPNGAGKTTLLRVIAGDRAPDSGEVRLAGRPLREWTFRERARMRAVASQESSLEFPFTAFEVVLMGRTPHVDHAERPADHRITASALAAVGLSAFAGRMYPTLSGGEKQRTHLARALAQIWEPARERYLLLDEPTASLDIAHQHEILRIARGLAGEGCTVVAVVHDLNLAAEYADQILLLETGRVHACGTPAAVLTEPNIRSAFGIDSVVLPHPRLPVPLVVPIGQDTSRQGHPTTKEQRT